MEWLKLLYLLCSPIGITLSLSYFLLCSNYETCWADNHFTKQQPMFNWGICLIQHNSLIIIFLFCSLNYVLAIDFSKRVIKHEHKSPPQLHFKTCYLTSLYTDEKSTIMKYLSTNSIQIIKHIWYIVKLEFLLFS